MTNDTSLLNNLAPEWLTEEHIRLFADEPTAGFFYVEPDNIIRVADLFKHGYVRLEPNYDGLEVHMTDLGRESIKVPEPKSFIKTADEVATEIAQRIEYYRILRKNSHSEPGEVNEERIEATACIDELRSLQSFILGE